MNGTKIFLDTSAISYYLQGPTPYDKEIEGAAWLGCSIVSVIEYYAFTKLSPDDLSLFNKFLTTVHIVDLSIANKALIKEIAQIRIKHRLKLPDAIIAASAIHHKCILVTGDTDFKNIKNLKILSL